MLITFLSVVAILGKFIWPSILKAVSQREAFIAQGVADAKEAALRLQSAQVEQAAILQEAHDRQLEIIRQTEDMKRKLMEEMREEAAREKQTMLDQARQQIAQSRIDAMNELKNEVVTLSTKISEKILRKTLDTSQSNEELIGRMLKELENKN
jgi:ATP synthase, F0 subunit b